MMRNIVGRLQWPLIPLTIPNLKQIPSKVYIKRRQIAVTGAFSSLYLGAKASTSEIAKGYAAKSTLGLMMDIWGKEGFVGFSKGFTACCYSAAFCGFIYFSLYKTLKPVL